MLRGLSRCARSCWRSELLAWNKWAEGVDINGTVANALRSEGASFLPNAGAVTDRFIVRTNMGTVVGTRGETVVKAVVSNDGHIITTYPVK